MGEGEVRYRAPGQIAWIGCKGRLGRSSMQKRIARSLLPPMRREYKALVSVLGFLSSQMAVTVIEIE